MATEALGADVDAEHQLGVRAGRRALDPRSVLHSRARSRSRKFHSCAESQIASPVVLVDRAEHVRDGLAVVATDGRDHRIDCVGRDCSLRRRRSRRPSGADRSSCSGARWSIAARTAARSSTRSRISRPIAGRPLVAPASEAGPPGGAQDPGPDRSDAVGRPTRSARCSTRSSSSAGSSGSAAISSTRVTADDRSESAVGAGDRRATSGRSPDHDSASATACGPRRRRRHTSRS